MKVPTPKKLDSGTWYIRMRLSGEEQYITGDTAKECRDKATLLKAEHKNGKKITPKIDKTLGEIIDDYIAKYEPVLSPSTIRGYSSARKNRFKNYMAQKISDISDWQKVINDELKGSGEKTVQNGWGVVTAAMRDAGLRVPEVKLARPPVREMAFLEPEEIPRFCKALEGHPAEIEVLLELHGLRESEVMSVVRNNRIDTKRNIITVSGAIVPNKENRFVEKQTNKTKKSTRQVPIMIQRLADLVDECERDGKPIRAHSAPALLKAVHSTCAKAGVTDVTNHGLRHTFASLGYSLGLSERMMMDLGGWDDPTTMHKIYIRLAQRDKANAQNAIADFFKNAT